MAPMDWYASLEVNCQHKKGNPDCKHQTGGQMNEPDERSAMEDLFRLLKFVLPARVVLIASAGPREPLLSRVVDTTRE